MGSKWREERIGNQRLILGDCLEVLPTLEAGDADCFLTDPPYGIAGKQDIHGKGDYAGEWQDDREYLLAVTVPVVEMCVALCGRGALTPGNNNLRVYPDAADVGCFWTPAGAGLSAWGFTTFHPILYYGQDPMAGKGRWPTGRQVTEASEKNGHPCPKPIGAWSWLLRKVSMDGETVLDPFLGSGTTLVAAELLGRRGIGIEIDPGYFEVACRRVEQAAAQPRLFTPDAQERAEQYTLEDALRN